MKKIPDRVLVDLVNSLSKPELQNRLYYLAAREIAIAMTYLSDRERDRLFSLMSPEKYKLVREELSFQKRVIVTRQLYLAVMERVIKVLGGEKNDSVRKGYLRPG